MATGRDEVEIAPDTCLCRMEVTKIVRAVYDPKFLVTRGGIQDLLARRKHDQGGEANLCANLNNVGLCILNSSCPSFSVNVRRR